MLEYVGEIELNGTVDITDPCYDKDVWCRMTADCDAGLYKGYIELVDDDNGWGTRVSSISIFKGNKIWNIEEMKLIGTIGVDAGLAGFFNNKKDFNDKEWEEFCSKISDGEAWCLYDGIFSSSGYGDGVYNVYANEELSAFTIVFIDPKDDEMEEYDE